MLDVLVVDDSDIIRTMVLKTLHLAKVPVGCSYEASNGREALDILEGNWVDLVLADINMPVMDGVEMIGRMRDSDEMSAIPVIVLSAEGTAARVTELCDMGVTAYLRKPFTPEMLRDVVGNVTSDWKSGDHGDLLGDVFRSVLAKFAFMHGEIVATDELSCPGTDLLRARMTFSGAVEGALEMAAPRRLCRQMAANVLGEEREEGISVEREADALGEVLNMACGHVATALEADAATSLSPPVVTRLARDEWERMSRSLLSIGVEVEDEPVLLTLGVRNRGR